jgi:hypothetical protein
MSTRRDGADRQDDCYHSELQAMINVVDGKADSSTLLSSYADAAESYKLVCHSLFIHYSYRLMNRLGRSDWRERGVIRREVGIPILLISRVFEDMIVLSLIHPVYNYVGT